MRKVTVEFERDLCCHAVGQCLDEIAQHILFFREQIPTLVSNIVQEIQTTNSNNSNVSIDLEQQEQQSQHSNCRQIMQTNFRLKKRREFVTNFLEIRHSLRKIFSSKNDRKIRRAVLLLGDSPACPKDAYFVNFEIRVKNNFEIENDEFCRHLNEREFARLARTLIASDQSPFNNMKRISVCKFYVLLEAERNLDFSETKFLPRSNLNLDKIISLKPNTNIVSINLQPKENVGVQFVTDRMERVQLESESDLLWFICEHPIAGLSD